LLRICFLTDFGWLDPDPHWESGSGARNSKMTQKIEKSEKKIHVFEVLIVLF
jgi:hypothetical protein